MAAKIKPYLVMLYFPYRNIKTIKYIIKLTNTDNQKIKAGSPPLFIVFLRIKFQYVCKIAEINIIIIIKRLIVMSLKYLNINAFIY